MRPFHRSAARSVSHPRPKGCAEPQVDRVRPDDGLQIYAFVATCLPQVPLPPKESNRSLPFRIATREMVEATLRIGLLHVLAHEDGIPAHPAEGMKPHPHVHVLVRVQ